MVSDWVRTPHRNYGLIINPDPEASADSYRYFRSSSYEDQSQRPYLIVTCRVSRGLNLFWENRGFVIEAEPWVPDPRIIQSSDEPGGPWTNETDAITYLWWNSGDMGGIRRKFFRVRESF
jgi:hypothetical protein